MTLIHLVVADVHTGQECPGEVWAGEGCTGREGDRGETLARVIHYVVGISKYILGRV